jgi:hypothetical protein
MDSINQNQPEQNRVDLPGAKAIEKVMELVSKAKAKAAAKTAGRKYPSLVDNMNAAKEQRRERSRW